MQVITKTIIITDSENNPQFIITLPTERDVTDEMLLLAVEFYYRKFYEAVKVELIPVVANFTDIKATLDGVEKTLHWSFMPSVIV